MSFDAQNYLSALVERACRRLKGDEVLLASFSGEESDFVRLNNGAVRQAGSVSQLDASFDLVDGTRHAMGSIQLARNAETDDRRITELLIDLRERVAATPEDPYLLINTEVTSTEQVNPGSIAAPADALDQIRSHTDGNDMVGIYAAGRQYAAFANSLGQHNWHDSRTFNLDWSIYLGGDKATKELYAGFDWDESTLARKVEGQRQQLEALRRTPVDLAPDGYRTYLAPAALVELTGMLSWGGFSIRSHRTADSPLGKMVTDGARLHESVTITEDTAGGVSPNFQGQGYVKPDHVTLIADGSYADHLVSPRSAMEYGVETNAASAWEGPTSIAIEGGTVDTDQVLAELGTGLLVGNLWYLNFSDRTACRTTGMTRFATFWVENGEIVAPVNVLRYDDTAYRMLGENLVGLTDRPEMLLDSNSYGARSTDSYRLPGVIVEDMRFTL